MKYTRFMLISQNNFLKVLDGMSFRWSRVANAYITVSAVFAIGVLAFVVLTHEPPFLGQHTPLKAQTARGDLVGLAPAGGMEDRYSRIRPTAPYELDDRNIVRPSSIIVRSAFQGAY
jgi:hypothetical protein